MIEEMHGESQSVRKEKVGRDWKIWLDRLSERGMKNILFLSFVSALCIWYMNMNQEMIDTQRVLNKKHKELRELRWKFMDVKMRLMNAERESEIMANASHLGLKPLDLPAFTLYRNNSSKEQ